MDFFGMDLMTIVLSIANFIFWGGLIIGFIVFADKNPFMPRKTWKVRLKDKDHNMIKYCKSWLVKKKKAKYLRISIKDFSFKGVEVDEAWLNTADVDGYLNVIQDVPDLYEQSNYHPESIPITQKEKFVSEQGQIIKSAIVEALGSPDIVVKGKNDNGEEVASLNGERIDKIVEKAHLKTNNSINENSRLCDLNTTAATRARIDQVRREEDRSTGGDFLMKYGPMLTLILLGLFAYLMIDNAGKVHQAETSQAAAMYENGMRQLVEQCGGHFTSSLPNTTTTQKPGEINLPFITK